MANKIFVKNMESMEALNNLSDHCVSLESAYSNTFLDIAVGPASFSC